MFVAQVAGVAVEGSPLDWSKDNVALLARDGRLVQIDPTEVSGARRTAERFAGYSPVEMRPMLSSELGPRFEIDVTPHFLVAHPPGDPRDWAQRFETIYRALSRYLSVRGFSLREPAYPLAAIVYPTEADYYAAVRAMGSDLPEGMLGHYDPETNRVYLFDSGEDWENPSGNVATIIHEATHQVAFNVGVHTRFAESPRWLTEGLATLFEARGVWSPQTSDRLADRVNLGRLADYERLFTADPKRLGIAELVTGDGPFRSQSQAAYALSWALTLYLSETRPAQYAEYLRATSDRPLFARYGPSERLEDFRAAFGDDLALLERNFQSWMTTAEL